jgi:hypothetical protein
LSYSCAISSSSISILSKTTGLPSPSRHHCAFRRRSVAATLSIALALAPSIACRRRAVCRRRADAATTPPPSCRRRRTVALPPPLLPPPPHRHQAAADVMQSRCRAAADAAAAAAPPPSYIALSRCHAATTAMPPPSWCKPIPPCPTGGAAFFVPTRVIPMAASVARPRRGEEGSGLQKRHLIEGGREGDWVAAGSAWKFRRRSYVIFLFVKFIFNLHRDLQYRSEIPPYTSNGRKAKAIPSSPPPGRNLQLFWRKQKHQVLFSDKTSHE